MLHRNILVTIDLPTIYAKYKPAVVQIVILIEPIKGGRTSSGSLVTIDLPSIYAKYKPAVVQTVILIELIKGGRAPSGSLVVDFL